MAKSNYKKMAIKKDILNTMKSDIEEIKNEVQDVDDYLIALSEESNIIKNLSEAPLYKNVLQGNKLNVFIKRLIRKLTYWFISPIVISQNTYNKRMITLNDTVIRLLQLYKDKLALYETELSKLRNIQNKIDELDTFDKQISGLSDRREQKKEINYLDFENRFRGSTEEIKARVERYFDYFQTDDYILDIGCGRGELLELAENHSIRAKGIDIYEPFYKLCKKKGLNVELVDGLNYLNTCKNDTYDGIVSIHVIEHLSSTYLIDLIKACNDKLKNGGKIILETPNPKSVYTLTNTFYIDMGHTKPVHPETLKYLLNEFGFEIIKEDYPEYARVNDGIFKYQENMSLEFNKKIDFLNNLLYASQDYAIIAKKVADI